MNHGGYIDGSYGGITELPNNQQSYALLLIAI